MTTLCRSFLLIGALLVAGCDTENAPAPDRKSAAGQVLGGTISDAMLPLDTATSVSPPLAESPAAEASETPGAQPDGPGTPSAPAENTE